MEQLHHSQRRRRSDGADQAYSEIARWCLYDGDNIEGGRGSAGATVARVSDRKMSSPLDMNSLYIAATTIDIARSLPSTFNQNKFYEIPFSELIKKQMHYRFSGQIVLVR